MKTKLKKYWIVILIAVFLISFTAFSVSAAYTYTNKVKRVVSTQGGGQIAFSSNYLSLTSSEIEKYDTKRITFNNGESKTIKVTVSNFVHDNPSIMKQTYS